MLALYLIFIVFVFSLIPLLFTLTKRGSACMAMKKAIEREGGKVVPTSSLWYVGNIAKQKCDLHIYFDGRVISVKIIGFYTKNIMLNFISPDSYSIKELHTFKTVKASEVVLNKKKKKPYDFRHGLSEEGKKLPQAKIILIADPYPLMVSVSTDGGERREINIGSSTPEGELYTVNSFIKLFKN